MPTFTESYAHGTSDIPLIGETIGASFDRTVASWGDHPGLIVRQQGIRWSYRELGEKVDAFAAGLVALGLLPGSASASGRRTTPNGW
jgi:fatty-acyl-CoA synthase